MMTIDPYQPSVCVLQNALLIIAYLLSPVSCLIESMCFSPGFYHIHGPALVGPRHTGWDRLYSTNFQPWTHAFWGLPFQARTPAVPSPNVKIETNFVKDGHGVILDGWVHLDIHRSAFFQYLAVWAVNERNEAYGEFLYDKNAQFSCPKVSPVDPFYMETRAYIPCSAGPSNSASVPNVVVFANVDVSYDANHNLQVTSIVNRHSSKRIQRISLLWRAPPQTYCNRPELFKFIVAASGTNYWEDQWNGQWHRVSQPFSNMHEAGGMGAYFYYSDWVQPRFFGHPSRHYLPSTSNSLICSNKLVSSKGTWVANTPYQNPTTAWYSPDLWDAGTNNPDWDIADVKGRSTCKRERPDANGDTYPFGGRCNTPVDGQHHITSGEDRQLYCSDDHSPVGKTEFKDAYDDYLDSYFDRMHSNCECELTVDDPNVHLYSGAKNRLGLIVSNALIDAVMEYEDPEWCSQGKLTEKEQAVGGICVKSKPGTLVYGVRQWHGLTSLCVTLMITPMSIFIARYHKGEIVMTQGRLPLRGWYIAHVMLAFPAIWMYASGFATLSRQKDVLGVSLSWTAQFHRILGLFTCCLIPLQILTGFLRPLNLCCRKVAIFVHWFGGVAQHVLEMILCIFSSQIPASPTQSMSMFSPEFGTLNSSFVACVIIGWFVFSAIIHIGLMIRVKQLDHRYGVGARSVFPIIIPLMASHNEDMDIEHIERDVWVHRGAFLVFSLVSFLVLVVCIVSLYQSLYDRLYYGFGPMSCTHYLNGSIINTTGTDISCNH